MKWWGRLKRTNLSRQTKFDLCIGLLILLMIIARILCEYQHEIDRANFDYSTAPLTAVSVLGISVLTYAGYIFYLEGEIRDMEFDLLMLHMNDDIYSDDNLLVEVKKQIHKIVAEKHGKKLVQRAIARTRGLNPPVGVVI
ncbi:hypothetical protein M3Y94_01218200 [Aphelenchoides besseyi]|nr:hypothetical protein M3Y94_01218200 [Aphelenchoides besseyi]